MTKRKYHSVSRAARNLFKIVADIMAVALVHHYRTPFVIVVIVVVVVAEVTAHVSNNYTTRCDESYRGQCDTKTTRSPDMSPRKLMI